jgi:hypothetical protein
VFEPGNAHGIAFGTNDRLKEPGLYVLASGQLIERSGNSRVAKRLSGDCFDLLFADLAGGIRSTHHEYEIDLQRQDGRVTIIRISEAALRGFALDRYSRLIQSIRKRFADQMLFDVFVSYAGENEELATRWSEAMRSAGLTVYINEPDAMSRFEHEIDVALAESRVFMPIISRDALESKWVRREIEKRLSVFDPNRANILPVALEEGLAERMAVGFAPIIAGRRGTQEESKAIDTAVRAIREVRVGQRPPPCLTR